MNSPSLDSASSFDRRRPGEGELALEPNALEPNLEAARARVQKVLRRFDRVLIAFSGGVDSTLLLALARGELGEAAVAVIGVSPSLLPEELEAARLSAAEIGAPLREVATHEIDDPRYAANPTDRCFWCKNELWSVLGEMAREQGFEAICDGTNLDDEKEWRPGARAGLEHQVVSPLREAGLDKNAVRALSRALELRAWDKPAMPCLASRIPYGQKVTPAALHRVGRAEVWLRERGLSQVRVRHYEEANGPQARLEIAPHEMDAFWGWRDEATTYFATLGFTSVLLDLEGYRRGKLGDGLDLPTSVQRAAKPLAVLL